MLYTVGWYSGPKKRGLVKSVSIMDYCRQWVTTMTCYSGYSIVHYSFLDIRYFWWSRKVNEQTEQFSTIKINNRNNAWSHSERHLSTLITFHTPYLPILCTMFITLYICQTLRFKLLINLPIKNTKQQSKRESMQPCQRKHPSYLFILLPFHTSCLLPIYLHFVLRLSVSQFAKQRDTNS